jgi:hypothetical protein
MQQSPRPRPSKNMNRISPQKIFIIRYYGGFAVFLLTAAVLVGLIKMPLAQYRRYKKSAYRLQA